MMSEEVEATNEEYDSFDVNNNGGGGGFLFDPASIAHVNSTAQASSPQQQRRLRSSGGASRGSRSAATTQLATDVGSTIVRSKIPFLKSITFFDPEIYYRRKEDDENVDVEQQGVAAGAAENSSVASREEFSADEDDDDVTVEINNLRDWDIQLADPPTSDIKKKSSSALLHQFKQSKIGSAFKLNKSPRKIGSAFKLNKSPRYLIADFTGLMEYSHFQSGDHLLSINKQIIDPREMTAQEARSYMNDCLEKDGVLNVVTENPNGDDILINVTVIKPRRSMNYEDLGLIVWNWPYLCVRQINEGSIFEHTPVQETDQIVAINDIDCSKMRTRAFATCVEELPTELTITLIRRKHRYTGSFK
ncbi:hypothetical protein ACHAWC_002062 [Mediolabrus comicus]